MNQTSRQSKFKSKLSNKMIHKSSLPNIDSVHVVQSRQRQNIVAVLPATSLRQNSHNKNVLQKQKHSSQHQQNQIFILESEPRENKIFFEGVLQKNKELQIQKQLTMDTILNQDNQNKNLYKNNKETSSKGFDMWSLNKNLKQFSETRKLGFYKTKNQITQLQSPYYHMNKTRTQQIRSVNKLYGGNNTNPERQKSQPQIKLKKFVDPIKKITQKDVKSFSTIEKKEKLSNLDTSLYGTLPVKKTISNVQSTTNRNNEGKNLSQPKFHPYLQSTTTGSNFNPYLRTFINGSHLKRQPSNRNLQILQMNSTYQRNVQQSILSNIHSKNKHKGANNIRKNRFQKVQKQQQLQNQQKINFNNNKLNQQQQIDIDKTFSEQYSKSLECRAHISPQKNAIQQVQEQKYYQNEYQNQFRSASSPTKLKSDLNKKPQDKRKLYEYNKSIQKINKSLLSFSDGYLDFYKFNTMPTSKIQFYIDSLNHPEFSNQPTQYKSSFNGNQEIGYNNFSFLQPVSQNSQKNKNKRQIGNSKNKNKNANTTRN